MVILVALIHYSERMQSKTSKGKRHVGQSTEETRQKLPRVFSRKDPQDAISSSATSCDNAYGVLPTREAP